MFLFHISIPADYPPPPPPAEESTGFPSSPGSYAPPPMNSYDYQVRQTVYCCYIFLVVRNSLRVSTESKDSPKRYTEFMHQVQQNCLSILSCSQLQRLPAPDAAWSQPPELRDPHTNILSSFLRALMQ